VFFQSIGRGTCHLAIKWPGGKKQSSLSILDVDKPVLKYTEEDSGQWKVVLALECRGLEPVAWQPRADFAVTSLGGKRWESVDLSELDWSDYDEDNDMPLSITSLECKIDVRK